MTQMKWKECSAFARKRSQRRRSIIQTFSPFTKIGEFGGANFITAEFVDGLTLRARMKAEALSPELALEIASQIAGALSAAHTRE